MEDLGYYKCKECPERFRTTFDLQKHKRTNHRISNKNSQINKSVPPASSTGPNNDSEGIEPNTGGGVTGEITSTPSGRHLTCAFCRYKYDTKDPVVVHLLKLCRRENNGSLKCPFCVKVKLEQSVNVTSDSEARGTTTDSSKSLRPKRHTRPTWRISEQERRKSSGSTATISSSSSAPVTSEGRRASNQDPVTPTTSSRRPLKRGSSSQTPRLIKKSMRQSLYKSEIPSRTPSAQASSASTESTPAALLSSSGFNSASVSPTRKSERDDSSASFFSGSQQRSYELTFHKQNEGKPDSQSSSTNGNLNDNYQTPTSKVSVLFNSEPVSSGSRLAVPKAKDFDKGNLRCQYCSYVATSFREIQSHINTHLAKSYPCEFCSNIYRSKQYVAKHTATHHPDKVGAQKMSKETSFMSIASTICGNSNNGSSFSTANTDSQSSNSASNPSVSAETSLSNYFFGSEIPSAEPQSSFHEEHREFFMFAKENKEVEKIVKLENF